MEDLFKIIVVLCFGHTGSLNWIRVGSYHWNWWLRHFGVFTLEDLKAESNSESKGNNEFNDALKNCVSQG